MGLVHNFAYEFVSVSVSIEVGRFCAVWGTLL